MEWVGVGSTVLEHRPAASRSSRRRPAAKLDAMRRSRVSARSGPVSSTIETQMDRARAERARPYNLVSYSSNPHLSTSTPYLSSYLCDRSTRCVRPCARRASDTPLTCRAVFLCAYMRRIHIATVTATQTPRPPMPTRKSSIDPEAAHKLEKSLAQRPEKHELIDRNILKGTPALQPSGQPLNDVAELRRYRRTLIAGCKGEAAAFPARGEHRQSDEAVWNVNTRTSSGQTRTCAAGATQAR